MNRKPLFAAWFVTVESVYQNKDGTWILTYNTIGGKDDNLSNSIQFKKDFTFPSGETLDVLETGKDYVIRYKLHNNVMEYERAYEINIIKEIT